MGFNSHKSMIVLLLAERQGFICPLCNQTLEPAYDSLLRYTQAAGSTLNGRNRININLDHIIPTSKGGINHITNYQAAHTECNSKKGNALKGVAPQQIVKLTKTPKKISFKKTKKKVDSNTEVEAKTVWEKWKAASMKRNEKILKQWGIENSTTGQTN